MDIWEGIYRKNFEEATGKKEKKEEKKRKKGKREGYRNKKEKTPPYLVSLINL